MHNTIYKKSVFCKQFENRINNTSHTSNDKNIILNTFIPLYYTIECSNNRLYIAYYILTNAVTIFAVIGILVTTLQKVNGMSKTIEQILFWLSWISTGLILLANKLYLSFNISKKRIISDTLIIKLTSESNNFINLTGCYLGSNMNESTAMFFDRIERIRLKSSEIINDINNGSDILSMAPLNKPPTIIVHKLDNIS